MRKGIVEQRFFDFKRGKSKKIAILTAFLFVLLAGGTLLKLAQAQNGDFAEKFLVAAYLNLTTILIF